MAAIEVTMREPTVADAHALALRMRAADAAEVLASSGEQPLEVVRKAIDVSEESWAVFFDNELACIWGVMQHGDTSVVRGRVGVGWLLGTDLVEKHAKLFWKTCRALLPEVLQRWSELVNAIDARHVQAVRWARRLGFRLDEPAPFGAAGLPFRMFSVRREDLHV